MLMAHQCWPRLLICARSPITINFSIVQIFIYLHFKYIESSGFHQPQERRVPEVATLWEVHSLHVFKQWPHYFSIFTSSPQIVPLFLTLPLMKARLNYQPVKCSADPHLASVSKSWKILLNLGKITKGRGKRLILQLKTDIDMIRIMDINLMGRTWYNPTCLIMLVHRRA